MMPPLTLNHWVIFGLVLVACILLVTLTAQRDLRK